MQTQGMLAEEGQRLLKRLLGCAPSAIAALDSEDTLVLVNPMDGVKIKKPRRVPPVTLTEGELVRVLVAAVFVLGGRPPNHTRQQKPVKGFNPRRRGPTTAPGTTRSGL